MALKKEVHMKIEGNYVKGTIVGDIFKTNILVQTESINDRKQIGLITLKRAVEELQELVEILEGIDVANRLQK